MQTKKFTFAQFLNAFPTIEFPVTLNEEAHHTFSQVNTPLPGLMIDQFLAEILGPVDEYTEFIPCFRHTEKDKFHAIVVWKAGLLHYEYFLLTYDPRGTLLQIESIAGMITKEDTIWRKMALISEELIINVVEGKQQGTHFDSQASLNYYLEILDNGFIYNSRAEFN